MKSTSTSALLIALLSCVQSLEVRCPDQEEACVCPENEEVCEFELKIEELQTLTSYVVREGNLRSIETGDVYFMDRSGYHPVIPDDQSFPERGGQCYLTTPLVYDRDFGPNCSVPMTVDGRTYRLFVAVNGRIPGPTLIVDEDSLVKVRVVNRLTSEAVTIHWHGMHQRGTPWMDGVGFISQPPISAGASFDYIFRATPGGTHWYHSHVGAQRTDGLFGALIVREKRRSFQAVVPLLRPESPNQTVNDIPECHTLTLLDWQQEASLDLFVRIHSTLGFHPQNAIGAIPTNNDAPYTRTNGIDGIEVGPVPFWSGLINGRGRYEPAPGTPLTITPLSVFNVGYNSAYRFRVIGAQSLYAFRFSIDNHMLRVIASDGHFLKPRLVNYIVVHSGERYDIIIDTFAAEQQQQTLFWIRAETLEQLTPTDREHSARAILRYGDDETELNWRSGYTQVVSADWSCTETSPCDVLNCPFQDYPTAAQNCVHLTELQSLFKQNQSELPKFLAEKDCEDCLQFFNFGFEGQSSTSAINGRNFKLPVTPYQTHCRQYWNDVNAANSETCSNKCRLDQSMQERDCTCINVVSIAENERFLPEPKTVVMVFSAVGDEADRLRDFAHPIHLHGHSFHVLSIGHGTYSDAGILTDNSRDVECNDRSCLSPNWRSGTRLSNFIQNATGVDGRINNTVIRKDTVIVPAGGYVVVAFLADNPGYWFLHCHIEVHQLEGMGVLIEEYPYTQHSRPPAAINEHRNFDWSILEYRKTIDQGKRCGASGSRASLGVFFGSLVLFILSSL